MLDTQFPRPLGDVGNPATWARAGIPVVYAVVQGASPQRVVQQTDNALLGPFLQAACKLQAQGATMITTSCGFLVRHQAALAASVTVPVISSSLLHCKRLANPGVITIDAGALDQAVLQAAEVPSGTPLQGIEAGCEFYRRIMGNEAQLDLAQAELDVIAAASALMARRPDVTDVVLECTNMAPYRHAVELTVGRPVHDLETLLISAWAHSAVATQP